MNRKRIFHTVGQLLLTEAILLLLPIAVSLIYGEKTAALSLLATLGAAAALGGLLIFLCRKRERVIYAREGFLIVAFGWLSLSLVGALPFVISGEIPNFVDALFETVSGFTTTGASILKNVEAMSKGLLFWRSFTHWIGGMGILVFVMAVLPSAGADRSIHIMRAEMPGPIVGKLVPRARETAKILYLIYLGMTALQIVLLTAGGMSFYESCVHAFGTAGTGGFGVRADSIASYSPYLQWVITVFMLLFGVNFNLYYLFLIRKFRAALKSTELWTYLGIFFVSAAVIAADVFPRYESFGEALRHAAFQTSSVMTTTGYSTADFDLWPTLSKTILVFLMFVGACAGSTGGGLKVSRVVILFKRVRAEVKRLLHPRSVSGVKFEGRTVDDATLGGVSTYFVLFIAVFIGVLLTISVFDDFDFETNFTAAAACFNNIGPGLGAVGPAANYAGYGAVSKIVLSFAMLFGRLEIWPLLLAFSPTLWRKK